MSEHDVMSCAAFDAVAAELALGVLTGRERAQALAHLERCDACRENTRQLTITGEELLGLLPAVEPPAGFETRVMTRLGLTVGPRPAPAGRNLRPVPAGRDLRPAPAARLAGASRPGGRRKVLAVAAVTLAVVAAALGGWGLRAATSAPAASPLSSATLVSASHQTVGKIFLYNGGVRWMYMSVDLELGNSTVTCQLEDRNGHVIYAGSFQLAGGYGAWGSPNPLPSDQVVAVARLLTADGHVLATARFP